MKEKIILAYSGGLDTSIIISWLIENYDMDVIAACINVGQEENMTGMEEKALKTGAKKIYIENLTEEFLRDYVFKGVKANAKYEGTYLLGTAYARPLIAKKLVEIAHKEGAKYICHGCTGKGNDQVRFEVGIAAIDPTIKVIAPWRIWDINSREAAIDYATTHGIEINVTKEKIYSRDENIWHCSHEGGDIEDLTNEHNQEMYLMVTPPEQAKDEATYVEIYFEKGIAKKINGEVLTATNIVKTLNKIAGENGIGVIDIVENRLVGMKSRGIYETPGGTVLYAAHKELEDITLGKDTLHFNQLISQKYGELVYNGLWFTKLREALDGYLDETQEHVTGTVTLKLYKGNIMAAGKESPYALYDEGISSFGASDLYDHKDAEGFINLYSLPSKINAYKRNGVGDFHETLGWKI